MPRRSSLPARFAASLAQAPAALLRGLLGPACPACAEPLDIPACPICRRCRAELTADPLSELSRCPVCWGPKPIDERGACQVCLADPPDFGKLRSPVPFNAQARALAHQLKYGRRLARAPFMAEFMASCRVRWWPPGASERIDALVPVPLHPLRRWRRGFNQSEALAEALGAKQGLRVERDLLARVKATHTQVFLEPGERAENVGDAFAVLDPSRAAGRGFLLIDDVATSCATLKACARVLRQAGAARVDCLTFARA